MRRIAFAALTGSLAVSLLAGPAFAQRSQSETAAVASGLDNLCGPYFKPGASKKSEDYANAVKTSGWEMHEAPGVTVFNTEGGWGEGRIGFQSDFEGATCRITLWQPAGITTPHDDAPTLKVLTDWMARNLPNAKMTKNKQKPENGKGPPDALDTVWKGGKLSVMFRSVPPKGHRPVVYIDIKRD
jgi:hypothetical protein